MLSSIVFRFINNSTQIDSSPDDMDVETFLRESDFTHSLSTDSMVTSQHDRQLNSDNVTMHRQLTNDSLELARQRSQQEQQREQQQVGHQELKRLQERRLPPWQRRLQHAARLENITATIPTWLPRHRYQYDETKHEYRHREMSSDVIQQSPTDFVGEFDEPDESDPRERWEQEQINEFEDVAASEELLVMEQQEQQQRMDTDVDMDSGTE